MLRRLYCISGITTAIIALSTLIATPAHATIRTFDLTWSGVPLGNLASATGTLVIDDTIFPNPSGGLTLDDPSNLGVQSFTMTVTDASSGNGTFTLSDFALMSWDTAGVTLDFSSELVGQPTLGDPWGTPGGNGGDFNFLSFTPGAATGINFFTMATNAGSGDLIQLTSFAPAGSGAVAPEPGSLALLGMAALPFVGVLRRRIAR